MGRNDIQARKIKVFSVQARKSGQHVQYFISDVPISASEKPVRCSGKMTDSTLEISQEQPDVWHSDGTGLPASYKVLIPGLHDHGFIHDPNFLINTQITVIH